MSAVSKLPQPRYGQYAVPPADVLVNLRVGQPSPTLLPLDLIRQAANAKFAETDPEWLQYGACLGYREFRDVLAGWLTKKYKAPVDPERLMATNGISGALALILSVYTRSGDLIFAEEPTYFLAKSIFDDFKLKLEQIPQDKDGLDVDKLEERLAAGFIPKFVYIVVTAHNPSGRTLTVERRKKLVELSVKYKFIILSDEVYQLLTFPHITPPEPMFVFDKNDTVMALGSFSKILSPGLRVGWIQAAPSLLKRLTDSGQVDSSGGLNPLGFGVCEKAISLGLLDKHLDFARSELDRRFKALSAALDKHLPEGVTYEVPQGGYFCLVKLPDGYQAKDLLDLAIAEYKVGFLPGSAFSQTMDQYIRLSFSYYTASEMAVAAERLGNAMRDFLGRKRTKVAA